VPDKNAILIIKHVGFVVKEIPVPQSRELTVQLTSEGSTLSDVVVVGYGTQKKLLTRSRIKH
jgi:hypothetical protein